MHEEIEFFYVKTVGKQANDGIRETLRNLCQGEITSQMETLSGKKDTFWVVKKSLIQNLLKTDDYRKGKDYQIYVPVKNDSKILTVWAKNRVKKFKDNIINGKDARPGALAENHKLKTFQKLKKRYAQKTLIK